MVNRDSSITSWAWAHPGSGRAVLAHGEAVRENSAALHPLLGESRIPASISPVVLSNWALAEVDTASPFSFLQSREVSGQGCLHG